MHESAADLRRIQQLLDRSYASAGGHLLRIHTPERRATAEQVAERLTGMCLLVVTTVTADCRPVGGPVDGVFYRGAFHFGSSPDSLRYRHIASRPQVKPGKFGVQFWTEGEVCAGGEIGSDIFGHLPKGAYLSISGYAASSVQPQ